MLTKLFNFTDPTLYTFDSNLIDFTVSQKPRLKLQDNPGQDFVQDFSSDVGFVYDSNKAEFVGGKLQQVDKAPAGSVCWATYTTDKDLNVSINGGSLTGTLINGATVSGGYLNLLGGVSSYADYAGLNNVDTLIQEGTIKFILKPNYSGTPAGIRNFIVIAEASGDSSNLVNIYHKSSDGNIKVVIKNQTTGTIMTDDLGVWNPTAGTDYEFELNFIIDTAVGANTFIRLFIDGVQFGATKTGVTGTRNSNIGLIRVGSNVGTGDFANHSVKDLIFYDTVQHTANYIPGYTLDETRYLASNVIVPEMEYTGAGTLVTFDSFYTTESGSPRYTLQIGQSGDYLYWDGSAWSVSDGTYAQANDETTFNTNVGDLNVEGEIYGQFKMHFTDSNTQSWIDELTASLTAQIYPLTNPSIVFTENLGLEAISAFSETSTKTGSDEIKYILSKDSVQYYWDGAAWSISDGTYAQSNTAAEIETNKAVFTSAGVYFEIEMFLHSDTGVTTPEVTLVSVSYDFWGGNIDAPHKTIVFGVCYGEDGNVLPDAEISIDLSKKEVLYNTELILFDIPTIDVVSDSNGYWEAELIDTANMDGAKWVFVFTYDGKSKTYTRGVPEVDSINFAELPF